MDEQNIDVIQGTLDVLIVKTLSLEPMHGFGIVRMSRGCLYGTAGSLGHRHGVRSAAALALTRLMKSLLYDVSPADPLTYAGVSAGLILAAALASYLPARRAARVDPLDAMRAE